MREKLIITTAFLSAMSLIAIIITIYDKNAAIRSKYRISEKTLMLVSVFGGSVSMYITMKIIHHKTRKKKFMIGLPLIIVMQLIFLICIFTVNI